jgi:protein-S-isoprenylcysteine O-methyltransferase Ste14
VFLLFGVAELTRNVWFVILAFAFAGLVTLLQIIPEERHLEARFGQDWRDYAARTRRWI